MLQSNYIEADLVSNLLDFKILITSRISEIRRAFNLQIKHTLFVANINRDLNKIFVRSEGIKSLIANPNVEITNLKLVHSISKKSLFHFRNSYARLEKNKFFKNSTTRKLSDSTLSNFYTIEYKLRTRAYADTETSDDKEVLDFASSVSLGSNNLYECSTGKEM